MNGPVSQDLPDIAYLLWILGIAVAILIILPVTFYVLRRGLATACRLRSDLKEMCEAQERIEQYCRNLTASNGTTDMTALLKLAESLTEHRAPISATSTGTNRAGSPEHLGGAS